jgi:hypothetical protein
MKSPAKISAARQLVRKIVTAIAPRHAPMAWIDSEHGIAFSAMVTPRVRDGLVLRPVGAKRSGRGRSSSDANGFR